MTDKGVSLIKIDGKAVNKLIEVVSAGIGTIYKPRAIKKEAEAEAHKIVVLAEAEAKANLIKCDTQLELVERTQKRFVNQEVNRQINIEEIAEKAIKYLKEDVSEEPVDNNWRTRFFNKAQDISGNEIQEIWAKILAGEISNPGNISIRTLEVISNISPKEAELFQKACSFATSNSLIWKLGEELALDKLGLNYNSLLRLRDAGLVHDNDALLRVLIFVKQIDGFPFDIGHKFYKIKNLRKPESKDLRLDQIAFTTAGKELCKFINAPLNSDYIDAFIKAKEKEGYEILPL